VLFFNKGLIRHLIIWKKSGKNLKLIFFNKIKIKKNEIIWKKSKIEQIKMFKKNKKNN